MRSKRASTSSRRPFGTCRERHRSVRAAFDHSWRMLNKPNEASSHRLSVFHGGFQKEAAERVAGATLPTLMALINKSFMTRNPVGRFEIHELLRQYGAEKLNERPNQRESTHNAHARFYSGYLIDRDARLKTQDRAEHCRNLSPKARTFARPGPGRWPMPVLTFSTFWSTHGSSMRSLDDIVRSKIC